MYVCLLCSAAQLTRTRGEQDFRACPEQSESEVRTLYLSRGIEYSCRWDILTGRREVASPLSKAGVQGAKRIAPAVRAPHATLPLLEAFCMRITVDSCRP